MAEILISLTIIGVIAAITLPSLRANINESAWATQRKALYSRMSQAIAMMPSLNGYGIGATDAETASRATQAFITDGLSKVLKINNICAAPDGADYDARRDAYTKCGFPKKIRKHGKAAPNIDTPTMLTQLNIYFNGNYASISYSQINTNAVAFETSNGESILTFYNPNCGYTYGINLKNNEQNLIQPTMCANFIFDMNGRKGPNQVGKDIGFMTAFYPTDSVVVAPTPLAYYLIRKNTYPEYSIGRGNARCRAKFGKDARMANIEELKSIFVNNNLGYYDSDYSKFLFPSTYVSSSVYKEKMYTFSGAKGAVELANIGYDGDTNHFYCVK